MDIITPKFIHIRYFVSSETLNFQNS